ncbi:MAG: 4-hydroxy-3-methylbut-2-enyl diphosphate reductase [Desulfococcus multivorans]|uniref:4-hydroxy-3-methylbut-2-enyl diphosphate reductase n=1 Tax=Desulfococcus sp. TaxID=2025834 RepID=UPI002A390D67|nr:4-hydroxy-3-methylbut-2-enyl diphosphate reductase [Desulfococcus multivorans]
MKISVARNAGFCMGVQRAVEMALDASHRYPPPIYTYGPLIHNPQVLKLLDEKGISVMNEIPEKGSGTVLIRAHGVPPDTKTRLESAGYTVIDATCPRVIKVQAIIQKHAREGFASIIVGDRDHPEVIGLLGYAGSNGHVVGRLHDLDTLPAFDKAIIVAQTTQNVHFFEAVKKWAQKHHPGYKVFETICGSTEQRQNETQRLAKEVDAVIVVGGRNSGNTQRLVEIVKDAGKPVCHIETESDLDMELLRSVKHIGITAGASTPNWIIKRIYRIIEALPLENEKVWKRRLFMAQRFALATNLYIAVGAGALCYACSVLQNVRTPFPYILISSLYVLSMHTLNNLTGLREARYNNPDLAVFFETHKSKMILLALSSGAIGLFVAAGMGILPFVLLLIMTLMGLSYNLQIVPDSVPNARYRSIRDIPGSKTLLISLAWGVVTALFPILAATGTVAWATIFTFIWSVAMVFVRTAFFEVLDMQGDQIVGKNTIPILLGKKQTLALLRLILLFVFVMLFLSVVFGVLPGLALALILCPIYLAVVMAFHRRAYIRPGIRLEFLTESQFLLAGLITLIWRIGFRG